MSKPVPSQHHFRPEPLCPPRPGIHPNVYQDYVNSYLLYVQTLDALRDSFWSSKKTRKSAPAAPLSPAEAAPVSASVPLGASKPRSYGSVSGLGFASDGERVTVRYGDPPVTRIGTVSLGGDGYGAAPAHVVVDVPPIRDGDVTVIRPADRVPLSAIVRPAPPPAPTPVAAPSPAPLSEPTVAPASGEVTVVSPEVKARRAAARRRQRAARRLRDSAKVVEQIEAKASVAKATSKLLALEWTVVKRKSRLKKDAPPRAGSVTPRVSASSLPSV